jgi:hypothetical protein
VDQLTIRGGYVAYNTTGTLGGNTILSGQGVLDFSGDSIAKTVTNPIEMYGPESQILDPHGAISSLVVDFDEIATATQVQWGLNYRLTRAAVA